MKRLAFLKTFVVALLSALVAPLAPLSAEAPAPGEPQASTFMERLKLGLANDRHTESVGHVQSIYAKMIESSGIPDVGAWIKYKGLWHFVDALGEQEPACRDFERAQTLHNSYGVEIKLCAHVQSVLPMYGQPGPGESYVVRRYAVLWSDGRRDIVPGYDGPMQAPPG